MTIYHFMVLLQLKVFLLMSIYGHKTDMDFLTFEPENVTDLQKS
jgi:hypothetical protein